MLRSRLHRDVLADFTAVGAFFAVATTLALATSQTDAFMRETATALPGMVVLAVLMLALFGLVEVLDRSWRLDRERTRKLGHVGAGLIALLAPALFHTPWPMLLLTASFAGILVASRRIGVLEPLHPAGRRGAGDLAYAAGLYAAFALAAGSSLAFQIAVLVLALADPAAAFAGRAIGRTRYRALHTTRSLEGSLAFLVVAFLVTAPLLATLGLAFGVVALRAITVAMATAIVEALSPGGLDNLTVPVAAVLALGLFA